MILDAISLLSRRGGAYPAPPRRLSPAAISSEPRIASSPRVFCAETSAPSIASQKREENLSYGLSGGFSEAGVDFADGVVGFAAAGFPTVKYLRIFSSRFVPSPRIASKSSTLLNAPYDLRICKIFSAVAGPIPGTCCSSSDVAVFRFTGLAGGFFFPASTDAEKIKQRKRKQERSRIGNSRATAAI
jgi:hypothetical protein